MLKRLLGVLTPLFILALLIHSFLSHGTFKASADGMIIRDPYDNRFDYVDETEQQAYIQYANGMEKMVISISSENVSSDRAIWIFPVPSEPDDVVIDIVDKVPEFYGEEITGMFLSNLDVYKEALSATQIYPYIINQMYGGNDYILMYEDNSNPSYRKSPDDGTLSDDVVVHEVLVKEGITTEIVTAQNADALYGYLQRQGFELDNGSLPILDNYIGKGFTFVVSWLTEQDQDDKLLAEKVLTTYFTKPGTFTQLDSLLSKYYEKYPEFGSTGSFLYESYNVPAGWDPYELKLTYLDSHKKIKHEIEKDIENLLKNGTLDRIDFSDFKAVSVTFKSDSIFYPLMPTSVYESKVIPTQVRIVGHVDPQVFQEIKNYTKVDYYINGSTDFNDDSDFVDSDFGKYTKISINAPSKLLKEDLYANPDTPLSISILSILAEYYLLTMLLLLVFTSSVTSIVVAMLLFKNDRNVRGVIKWAFVGVANIFSIVALSIAIFYVKTKKGNDEAERLIRDLKSEGVVMRRRWALFLVIVSIILSAIGVFYLLLATLDLIPYFSLDLFVETILIPVLIMFSLVVGMVIIISILLVYKRNSQVDEKIQKLKSLGYSGFSFVPKDSHKILYIVLFSLLFLVVSSITIEGVRFILEGV